MNPLMQRMGTAPTPAGRINLQAVQSVKRMMGMLQAVKNPQQAIMMAAQQNPALGSVMQMIGGRDPKEVFYEQCSQHGVNPDDVLNLLR